MIWQTNWPKKPWGLHEKTDVHIGLMHPDCIFNEIKYKMMEEEV